MPSETWELSPRVCVLRKSLFFFFNKHAGPPSAHPPENVALSSGVVSLLVFWGRSPSAAISHTQAAVG